jgi:arylsulfatase A-like enzyme
VIVILADDLGYTDLGCYGCKDYPTPHIDSLAKNGVRFTHGYSGGPWCAPSRHSILFGSQAARGGARPRLNLAQLLQDAGYRTALIGKVHGHTIAGFEESFTSGPHPGRYIPDPKLIGGGLGLVRNGKKVEDEKEYLTDAQTREALAFIQKNKDQPFLLYLPYNAIHANLQATAAYLERFPAKHKRLVVAGAMAALDDGVGRILGLLRELKLEENTLIVFASDNGGLPQSNTNNGCVFRGFKTELFEGGLRIPFILQWTGKLPKGKTHEEIVCHMDIFATTLAAAGVAVPDPTAREGVDLLPFAAGKATGSPHEYLFWAKCSNKMPDSWAVRWNNWKLWSDGKETVELFDLAKDPGESKNLAGSEPAMVRSMTTAIESWKMTGVPEKK